MFEDYYASYLNLNSGININNCIVCKSEHRDLPINKRFIYKMIITDHHSKHILSVSPTLSNSMITKICTDIRDKSIDEIHDSYPLYETGLRISKMNRMLFNCDTLPEISPINSGKLEYIAEYKKYVIRSSGKIVSYCKVSDIDYGYGNLVLWTDENHRRKGYARNLLLNTISMCRAEGIVPVYLVNSQNSASLELATSVGFKIVKTEIIACEEIFL